MKTNYLWAAGLAGLPFLIILCLVATGNSALLALDQAVNTALYGGHYPLLVPIIRAFTYLGDNYLQLIFIALLGIWLVYKREKQLAIWLLLTNFLTISGINQLVKFLIERPRPDLFDHLILVGGYSFPSGHSMGSVVFYGSLALTLVYLWPRHFKHPALLYSLASLLSLALAWSRIFLGVHYFSDTLAGLSLGLACLILAKAAMDRWVDERPQVQ